MTEPIVFALLFFPCATVVLVYAFKYLAGVLRARAQANQDEAYRELAARAAAAQSQLAAALAAQGQTLADIQARLVKLEAILKQVE